MTTYKYLTETTLAKIDEDGLSRSSCTIENPEYLAWLSEGNTPDPVDPPTAEELAAEAARQALIAAKAKAKADTVVQYLRERTVAECVQYVDTNVTDLASAKAFLKKVATVMSVLCKEL